VTERRSTDLDILGPAGVDEVLDKSAIEARDRAFVDHVHNKPGFPAAMKNMNDLAEASEAPPQAAESRVPPGGDTLPASRDRRLPTVPRLVPIETAETSHSRKRAWIVAAIGVAIFGLAWWVLSGPAADDSGARSAPLAEPQPTLTSPTTQSGARTLPEPPLPATSEASPSSTAKASESTTAKPRNSSEARPPRSADPNPPATSPAGTAKPAGSGIYILEN